MDNKIDKKLRLYKKKSTFKGATDSDFWYSGTLSNGCSVIAIFKCEITTKSSAFDIANIIGNLKVKEVTHKNETYTNYTYYINSCDFIEIEGEDLPV
jgi:Autophagy-related protein 27.